MWRGVMICFDLEQILVDALYGFGVCLRILRFKIGGILIFFNT